MADTSSGPKTPKITFHITEKEWADLKIMCVLTHSTMSEFIRKSIRSKIKEIKSQGVVMTHINIHPQEK